MQRVMIVGCPGAGKTWLARALGAALGLPVSNLDHIQLYPDGRLRPRAKVIAALQPILAQPAYVLEGGYRHTFSVRLAACDTLIWLDMPLTLRCWRLLHRARARRRSARELAAQSGQPIPVGAQMHWGHVLLGHVAMRSDVLDLIATAPPSVSVWHLRSKAEVDAMHARCTTPDPNPMPAP